MKKTCLLLVPLLLLLTACRFSPSPERQLRLTILPDGQLQPITARCTTGDGSTFACTESAGALTFTLCGDGSAACTLSFSGGSLTVQAERTGRAVTLSHTLLCGGRTTQGQAYALLPGGSTALTVTIPSALLTQASLTMTCGGRTYTFLYP